MNNVKRFEAARILFDKGLTNEEAYKEFCRLYKGAKPGVANEFLDHAFCKALTDGETSIDEAIYKAWDSWKGKSYVVAIPDKPMAGEIMAAAVIRTVVPDSVVLIGDDNAGISPTISFGLGGYEEAVTPPDNPGSGPSATAWYMAGERAADLNTVPESLSEEFREEMRCRIFDPVDRGESDLCRFLEGVDPKTALNACEEYLAFEFSSRGLWYLEEEVVREEAAKQADNPVLLLDDPTGNWETHLSDVLGEFQAVAWRLWDGRWRVKAGKSRAPAKLLGAMDKGPWISMNLLGDCGEFRAETFKDALEVLKEWGKA